MGDFKGFKRELNRKVHFVSREEQPKRMWAFC